MIRDSKNGRERGRNRSKAGPGAVTKAEPPPVEGAGREAVSAEAGIPCEGNRTGAPPRARSQSGARALEAKLQPYVPSEETRGTRGSLVSPCGTDLLTSYWSQFREAVPTVLCTAMLRAGAWQQWGHGTPPHDPD